MRMDWAYSRRPYLRWWVVLLIHTCLTLPLGYLAYMLGRYWVWGVG
jgi:hypothetical protein